MGLFDLPAPLLASIDQLLAIVLPDVLRLILWGILCGWLTMLVYRRLSRQEAIADLKAQQKVQQEAIAGFDGEFDELMPLIRKTFSLGFRQLGLSLGPALLATIPILFIVAWVATAFVYKAPEAASVIEVTAEPVTGDLYWSDNSEATATENGWQLHWPADQNSIELTDGGNALLELSDTELHGVIHKRKWWNWLIANPAGYLPEESATESVNIGLPTRQFLSFGPAWMRGSLFVFFSAFLLASIGFKFLLRIA